MLIERTLFPLMEKVKLRTFSLLRSQRQMDTQGYRAYAEINLSYLRHNLMEIRRVIPEKCKVMAVVKSEAYGHGAAMTAKFLQNCGVDSFAVAELHEGIALRKCGIKGEILILGYTSGRHKKQLIRYRLTQTIVSEEHANSMCETPGVLRAHLKLDTGMNRLGEKTGDINKLTRIYKLKRLQITGIYTHMARADSFALVDTEFTNAQVREFFEAVQYLRNEGITVGATHIQSSYGILNYPNLRCDYVRPGISLYGVMSNNQRTRMKIDLRPVLSLKAKVAMVKRVAAGETVGYGRTYTAPRHAKVAVISIGYADGLPRSLSGRNCKVLIRGHEAEIVGNICMDQLMIHITGLADVEQGDEVTIIGRDGDKILSVNQISTLADTINNEILSRIGSRVSRVYIQDNYE